MDKKKIFLLRLFFCIFILNIYADPGKIYNLPEKEEHLRFDLNKNLIQKQHQSVYKYLQKAANSQWCIEKELLDNSTGTRTITLKVKSIVWPEAGLDITSDHQQWEHRVIIYIPKEVCHDTALMHVGNGILYPYENHVDNPPDLELNKIAENVNSIVIEVRDIPNQFISFTEKQQDNFEITLQPKKEDDLLMYSCEKYLTNPQVYTDFPLQLNLAKAIMRVMTGCQDYLQKIQNTKINKFVLSGASKRGWASWLTAAFDYRVVAIIPIVCDFLNMKSLIELMLKPENNNYMVAGMAMCFQPLLKTDVLHDLIAKIDPLSYNAFLEMPKYILSSVGDKFIPPGTHNIFINEISNKNLRVFDNSGHYIDSENSKSLVNAMESFYGYFLSENKLPEINYSFDGKAIAITSSIAPKKAILKTLINDSNNFIFNKEQEYKIITTSKYITIDKQDTTLVTIEDNPNLWQHSFIELHYDNRPFDDLIITTPIFSSVKTTD